VVATEICWYVSTSAAYAGRWVYAMNGQGGDKVEALGMMGD